MSQCAPGSSLFEVTCDPAFLWSTLGCLELKLCIRPHVPRIKFETLFQRFSDDTV